NVIERFNLKTKSGVPLYDHLAGQGITQLGSKKDPHPGSFMKVVKDAEDNFNERFSHWSKQKDVWWKQYCERGWFELSTGFVCKGVFSYNNLMNTPIQGPSFHIVLWAMIKLHNWLKQNNMKSLIIGQIHDSILGDVHESELDDYIYQANY